MSIIEQIPSVTYKGNGTQTQFEFPFPILAEENLSVSIFNTIDKTTTELELGTDYDVVVENNEYPAENGYIIYMYKPTGEGLPAGLNLTIDRAVPYEQQSVYPPNTLLNPEQIEDDLDNLEMQIQQLKLKDGRLITIPPGYEGTTEDYLEEFWDAVQNGGEQALNAADHAEDAADRAEDAADEAEAWAKEQGLWEMDDNNDLFPIENTPITADDDWELDENGDIMPRGTVESFQYPTHVRVVDVFSKLKGLNLKTGQLVMTQGFYAPADGGGASYVCVNSLNDDETADGYGIIALNNGKYLKLRHNGILNVKWFGAYIDGEHDDSEAFNRTTAFIQNRKRPPSMPTGYYQCYTLYIPNGVMKINDSITIDASCMSVYACGTIIDASNISSTAINVISTYRYYVPYMNQTHYFKGFTLKGNTLKNCIGIKFSATNADEVNRLTWENILIESFSRGVEIGENCYMITLLNVTINACSTGFYSGSGFSNTGERMILLSCLIADCDIGIENYSSCLFITNSSIDYNKQAIITSFMNYIINSHIEWADFEKAHFVIKNKGYVRIHGGLMNCIRYGGEGGYEAETPFKYEDLTIDSGTLSLFEIEDVLFNYIPSKFLVNTNNIRLRNNILRGKYDIPVKVKVLQGNVYNGFVDYNLSATYKPFCITNTDNLTITFSSPNTLIIKKTDTSAAELRCIKSTKYHKNFSVYIKGKVSSLLSLSSLTLEIGYLVKDKSDKLYRVYSQGTVNALSAINTLDGSTELHDRLWYRHIYNDDETNDLCGYMILNLSNLPTDVTLTLTRFDFDGY